MSSLNDALIAASPRLSPRRVPLFSHLIYLGVGTLWVLLFARAFLAGGVTAWATGIAYVAYDTLLEAFVLWQTAPLRHPQPHESLTPLPPASRPTLGVVIAAHNEASSLAVTIAALLEQSDPPETILIGDDGSTDGSAALLEQLYGLRRPADGEVSAASPVVPSLRWLAAVHGGKASILNQAILRIESDIVVTVDADTILFPDALAAVRQHFTLEPALVAATGVLIPVCVQTFSGRLFQWFQTYEYIRNNISRFAWMRADSLLLVSGAFASFRRNSLLAVGGFDPACLVEDYEVIHRLYRFSVERGLGWRVRVLGDACARTDATATLIAFLRQRRRWFAGFLQTQWWNRDMTGNRRFGKLGTMMLPVKATDTLQPIYGLTAFLLLPVFLATGRLSIALPAFGIVAGKVVLDLAFSMWSVVLYRRWTGERGYAHLGWAFLAVVVEPFSFQLLRHTGAAWGWGAFLSRQRQWGARSRPGALSAQLPAKRQP